MHGRDLWAIWNWIFLQALSNVHWAAVYREHRAQWGVTRVRLPKRSECSKGSPYSQDIVRQALSSDSDLIQKVLCTPLCPALAWVAPLRVAPPTQFPSLRSPPFECMATRLLATVSVQMDLRWTRASVIREDHSWAQPVMVLWTRGIFLPSARREPRQLCSANWLSLWLWMLRPWYCPMS